MAELTSRIVWIPEREACAEASGASIRLLPDPAQAFERSAARDPRRAWSA